jgi:hypothetical protein
MQIIRMNFDDFLARSDNTKDDLCAVTDHLPRIGWIAGGAVRRTLINKPIDSDYDYFFKSEEDFDKFEKMLPSSLKLVNETAHHKHWRGTVGDSDLKVNVQGIKFKFYDTVEDCINSFDYTITMFALDGDDLVTTPEALWDLGRRKLVINKITYPVATMRRMLKYSKQGFTACSGCMASLYRETAASPEALAQLDIEYVD